MICRVFLAFAVRICVFASKISFPYHCLYMSKGIRKGYLSHRQLAKAQVGLRIKIVSSELLCSQTCSRDLEEASGKKHVCSPKKGLLRCFEDRQTGTP